MLNLEWDIHTFEVEESSNLIVKEAIDKGAPAGFVAIVHEQTGGYGMRGHTWSSPKGGLYFSLLLETSLDAEELPSIPMRFARVLLEGLQPYSTEELTIKPQNDIVLTRSFTPEFREKLVGISTEMYRGKLCVGIGVNVFRPLHKNGEEGPGIGFADLKGRSVKFTSVKSDGPGPQNLLPAPLNQPVYLEDFPAKELDVDEIARALLKELNDKLCL